MARYIWRNGQFVDRDGKPMAKPFAGQITMPAVRSDIESYASPIDGKMITSRSARREDMKRHNCIDARELPSATAGACNQKTAEVAA